MNKRIRKKKAKQALQLEQERQAQELAKLSPELVGQTFQALAIALGNVFNNLSVACYSAAEQWEKWHQKLKDVDNE